MEAKGTRRRRTEDNRGRKRWRKIADKNKKRIRRREIGEERGTPHLHQSEITKSIEHLTSFELFISSKSTNERSSVSSEKCVGCTFEHIALRDVRESSEERN